MLSDDLGKARLEPCASLAALCGVREDFRLLRMKHETSKGQKEERETESLLCTPLQVGFRAIVTHIL